MQTVKEPEKRERSKESKEQESNSLSLSTRTREELTAIAIRCGWMPRSRSEAMMTATTSWRTTDSSSARLEVGLSPKEFGAILKKLQMRFDQCFQAYHAHLAENVQRIS